ncbi:hypothetical protein ASPWEDRAFT_169406 [Aspergillus wentii DTO 134E9]|uniref:Uncharacterized protein n=1 Tax=Aspergillus wentii DTO 134E9 TaxID=1073089 RepID=A0A1L9RXJ7_ASPWE|nr:uncharacterized protein ASPWEDRAFT_169406 [Aspergillus wentii DTO 134E9]OJJ39568.1 hypothetical protein ASPWEDRAFT_169406 [Aspergillus wentii DTO 134E9]
MIPISMFLTFFTPFIVAVSAASGPVSGHLEKPNLGLNRRGDIPLDESLLAIQIGGIVGAYVIFVAILLTLLLVVGRRLRRAVHASNYSLQVEMMKPIKSPSTMEPSPVTPISVNLPSPTKGHSFNRSWSSLTKGPKSHISGNGSVATIDESVVANDRQRAQEQMEMLYAAVLEHEAKKEAGIDMSKDSVDDSQSPDSVQTNPFTDRSSRVSEGPSMKLPASPRSTNSRLSRLSSLSLFSSNNNNNNNNNNNSNSREPAGASKLRSPRIAIRKMSISSPLASPDMTASASYGEDQPPLTPRLYNPPPPPAPPSASYSENLPPLTPRLYNPPPPPAPPAASAPVSSSKPPRMGRAPAPAPLTLSTAGQKSASSLPFRDAFPLQSAPATKTTILERPDKLKSGPRTGLPTPYSPYMPFTPVTPLTPSRVVTKRQRKRETKENGLHVLNEDDMVQDDDDMWG